MSLPVLGFRRLTGNAGRHPLLWVARESLSLNALSGQVGTLTQAGTVTVTVSAGGTVAVNFSEPAWNYDATQAVTGLLLNTGTKSLAWTLDLIPQAMCGMVDFVEAGGIGTASGGVFYLGAATATGARIYIDSTGTQYRLTYTDGTTTKTATLSGTAPVASNRVRLRWTLSSAGAIAIFQSINGAAETTSTATALALPATWGGTNAYLNRVAAGNYGLNTYLGVVVMLGNQTQAVTGAPLS